MNDQHQITKSTTRRRFFFPNLRMRLAFYFLCFMVFIALFAPFIANDQPLYVSYGGKTFYPALRTSWIGKNIFGCSPVDTVTVDRKKMAIQFDITDWRKIKVDAVLWPIVPFSPEKPDYYNRDYVSPADEQLVPTPSGRTAEANGKFRHLLGTDDLGRDVLAGIIHGTRFSITIGVLAMSIATLIGLIIGMISGYFGDDRFFLSRLSAILFLPIVITAWFIAFIARSATITEAFEESMFSGILQFSLSLFLFFAIPWSVLTLANRLKKSWLGKPVKFPLDSIFSRFTEVFNSLPRLLLIVSLTAVIESRSFWLIVLIIGCTSWTEIARFTRAELLRIRELDYITAARASGMKNARILFKHALPNAMSSVLVVIAFGIAGAILIESGLSFLGIGIPEETVTWGSMISRGKLEMDAWWLLIFPGLALFITTVVFNLLGEGIRDFMDPRLRRRTR